MNSIEPFFTVMISWVATYLLHSTILLAVCWAFVKGTRTTSHFLVERLWKVAAVLGLRRESINSSFRKESKR